MDATVPAFCQSVTLTSIKRGTTASSFVSSCPPCPSHSAFVSPHSRKASTLPHHSRQSQPPVCQLGNIEDIPAERIPPDPSLVPDHWHRPGVYGIYSINKDLQYVAAVRDVGAAIAMHIRIINDPNLVFATRMIMVETVEQAPLGDIAENWVMAHYEHGPGIPPGNSDAAPLWREDDTFQPNLYLPPNTALDMVPSAIKRFLRNNKVVLFMKGTRNEPKCGFSKRTVDILDDVLGERFVCVDVLDEIRNRGIREEIKRFSQWPTIPQLYVNGDFVGGADIVQAMLESGELKALLEPLLAAK